MEKVIIKEFLGEDATPIVSPLYLSEGKGIDIRSSDLFFVGFLGDSVVASVRFCIENEVPMLRTMRVANRLQRQGVGLVVLKRFAEYLDRNGIRNTYCLPHAYLEKFYGTIGFMTVAISEVPAFLQDRLQKNRLNGYDLICMKRD